MTQSVMAGISKLYANRQDLLLELVATLTEEQIRWAPNDTTPSIAFHVWHLARWADYLQEEINGPGSQVWEQQGLAARWGLASASLGYAETGMEMDGQAARALPLPGKDQLLDYAREAFAKAQQAVRSISDDQFYQLVKVQHTEVWNDNQIGPHIILWHSHDSSHLGMIEAMVGFMGLPGSVSG
jgi:DinB family protein